MPISYPSLTDPGIPSYVEEGYVERGYQEYYSTRTLLTPGDPNYRPPGTLPGQGVTTVPAVSSGGSGSAAPPPPAPPNTIYSIPPIPPNWPTVPPSIPPETCPPLASIWATGPDDMIGDQISYTPPSAEPNDDGVTFPVSSGDVILQQQWHGIASTLDPANIESYNTLIRQTVHNAIEAANKNKTVNLGGVGGEGSATVSFDTTPFYDIQVAVQLAVLKSVLQGNNLWFELVLKPLTNGPFTNGYAVETTNLAIPMTVNLGE